MIHRILVGAVLLLACALPLSAGDSHSATDPSWVNDRFSLPDGAIVDSDAQIIPYFGNLTALEWTNDPAQYPQVQAWMRWYLGHLNWPDKWGLYGTVYDYNTSDGSEVSTGNADSTDSYAATFLSLAWAYWRTGDATAQHFILGIGPYWFDVIGNVIVAAQQEDGLTWARPDYPVKFLMDNCESYRGLSDLANLFEAAFGNTQAAASYRAHAEAVRRGIQAKLWKPRQGLYLPYATAGGVNLANLYPDAVAQLFPILNGVVGPGDPQAKAVYAAFNDAWPAWPLFSFNVEDGFAWRLAASAAVLMGDDRRDDKFVIWVDH